MIFSYAPVLDPQRNIAFNVLFSVSQNSATPTDSYGGDSELSYASWAYLEQFGHLLGCEQREYLHFALQPIG